MCGSASLSWYTERCTRSSRSCSQVRPPGDVPGHTGSGRRSGEREQRLGDGRAFGRYAIGDHDPLSEVRLEGRLDHVDAHATAPAIPLPVVVDALEAPVEELVHDVERELHIAVGEEVARLLERPTGHCLEVGAVDTGRW